jgi:hypothetical protein
MVSPLNDDYPGRFIRRVAPGSSIFRRNDTKTLTHWTSDWQISSAFLVIFFGPFFGLFGDFFWVAEW